MFFEKIRYKYIGRLHLKNMKRITDLKPGVPVILADGLFPESQMVLEYLDRASAIICCDGATLKLLEYGLQPTCIVGDMDSLPALYQHQFKDIVTSSKDQETNDLTKAVNQALSMGLEQAVIIGGTGQREDHTLGNIGLLMEHGQRLQLQMVSDYGVFTPLYESSVLSSFPTQQVSIFGVRGNVSVSYEGLKYPLNDVLLHSWWRGTLNEAESDEFSVLFEGGGVVVYRTHVSSGSR